MTNFLIGCIIGAVAGLVFSLLAFVASAGQNDIWRDLSVVYALILLVCFVVVVIRGNMP